MAGLSIWTPELDVQLAELWDDPALSTIDIGKRLGLTKNQVVGRAHRLGLLDRGTTPSLDLANAARIKRAADRAAGLQRPGCRWIEADDFLARMNRGENIYCDAPVAALGVSWCAAHLKRIYTRIRVAPVEKLADPSYDARHRRAS